jgi:serine-type D-Ala-D-Ala carboxypeptidase (penicillin-binding protein 5/6)
VRPQRLLIARSRLAAVAGGIVATALAWAALLAPAQAATTGLAAAAQPVGVARPVTVAAGAPAGVSAAGADLVNVATGRRLWSRGLNTERPIASITKVMTALVIIRAGDLTRKIRISQAVVTYVREHDGSSAGLHAGDILTAHQLLEGMLLPSGNDAAFALAGAYGPGWRAFVRKMNATARALGLRHTHFANFDGLPWPTEYTTYSTPRDLVILGRTAMQLAAFRDIVGQHTHDLAATPQHHAYFWQNTNQLLGSYAGAFGIKTGFTHGAGYSLLFEARRHGHTLIGVVLDSSGTDPTASFTAARRLLNWGFAVLAARRA